MVAEQGERPKNSLESDFDDDEMSPPGTSAEQSSSGSSHKMHTSPDASMIFLHDQEGMHDVMPAKGLRRCDVNFCSPSPPLMSL